MLQFLTQITSSLLSAISHYSFWIVVVSVIVGLFLILFISRIIRLLFQIFERLSFCSKLKKWAKKNKYKYTSVKNPVESFFHSYKGEDIILAGEKKSYFLKFLPFSLSEKSMHIENDSEAYIAGHFALFKNHRNLIPKDDLNGMTPIFSGETKCKKIRLDLSFDSEGNQNIVIIPAKAYSISFTDKNSKIAADCAVSYKNKFIFYRSDLLISYLDREEIK